MIKRGDIVLLSFPFTDLQTCKVRPALVVSSNSFNKKNQDAIFAFITTKEYTGPFDIRINENDSSFPETGLKASSTLRTSKLMCLEQKLARRRLGRADKHLLQRINTALISLLGLSQREGRSATRS
ncbi:MAG: type II toxin-antitoxin system PemK/MazF family toxin [Desulfobacteraceae bacterium]|nr:type II toxin-antitoxin system PemK/MazF family toxin [Desulfobacteraceae bacterium]